MNDDTTARFGLPLLRAGQAQKEMSHNEALALLDIATLPAAVMVGANEPPASPIDGACWIVGDQPVGAWQDRARALAGWTAGGWRFVTAFEGMMVWSVADQMHAIFRDGGWRIGDVRGARLMLGGTQVVGPRRPVIPGPVGGAVIDAEARSAVTAILATIRAHGLIET